MRRRFGGHVAEGGSRRWWRAGAVIVVGAAVLVASQTTTPGRPAGSAPAAVTATAAAPQVTTSPADGAADVAPAAAIIVTATDATLRDVAVTAEDGTAVPGSVSADGRTWTASAPPAYDTAYRFAGSATGPGGAAPVTGAFHTVKPKRLVKASIPSIAEGGTVGVAAPIEVRFDRNLDDADRATAERALSVTTSVPVKGAWAWLPDDGRVSRAHWRPEQYWPSGTTVTVRAAVFGLGLGTAGFGAADLTRTFTIGRSQIVKADVKSHRMIVVRDGQIVFDVPVSYGLESDPRRVTRNGIHVVMGKSETVFMSNPAFDYENVEMHWAVRISNNGEFIHANPASTGSQGKRNVTHGCVNLTTKNGKAYYDTAIFGDPVEVTNSSVALTPVDGDIYDWAIPWDQWSSMSALGETN